MLDPDLRDASLELEGLQVRSGERLLVAEASLSLQTGRILGLVGSSGSGKTLTARACIGLVEPRPGVVAGRLRVAWDGAVHEPYAALGTERERRFRALRGRVIGWLPQEARASLDPLRVIGRQVDEVLRLRARDGIPCPPGRRSVDDWLAAAGFPSPARVRALFPHELSGGMAQRACIALALARGSRFLLADEPTTGLDPTVQAEILVQLGRLRDEGCGVLLITHDLRILPRLVDRICVMDEGRVVETLRGDQLSLARTLPARRLLEATARVAGGLL